MSVFDYVRLPRVTVTSVGSAITTKYRVVVEMNWISPTRARTNEEILSGVESLDPPTIVASTVNDAKRLAVETTQAAIESTNGTISVLEWGACAWSVGYAVAGAFNDLGIDA